MSRKTLHSSERCSEESGADFLGIFSVLHATPFRQTLSFDSLFFKISIRAALSMQHIYLNARLNPVKFNLDIGFHFKRLRTCVSQHHQRLTEQLLPYIAATPIHFTLSRDLFQLKTHLKLHWQRHKRYIM